MSSQDHVLLQEQLPRVRPEKAWSKATRVASALICGVRASLVVEGLDVITQTQS